MTSWWRLRTQAYLVLSLLLCLIVFLGAHALTEAKRHAQEADDLLNANFRAAAILSELDATRVFEPAGGMRFRLARDLTYKTLFERQSPAFIQTLRETKRRMGSSVTPSTGIQNAGCQPGSSASSRRRIARARMATAVMQSTCPSHEVTSASGAQEETAKGMRSTG